DRATIASCREWSERGLNLSAGLLPILDHLQVGHRFFGERDTRLWMGDCAPVLIDHKDNRQTGVEQVSLALCSRLLHRIKNFLKRNNRHHGSNNVLIVCATEDGLGDRECHLLSRTNNLWAAHDKSTSVHAGEYLAYPGIHFHEFDHVGLERAVESTVDRPQSEGDEVGIFLKCRLETLIVAQIVERLDTPGDLKRSGKTRDDVSISLAVEFNLSRLILHELSLVPAFHRAQFVSAASGQQEAG